MYVCVHLSMGSGLELKKDLREYGSVITTQLVIRQQAFVHCVCMS